MSVIWASQLRGVLKKGQYCWRKNDPSKPLDATHSYVYKVASGAIKLLSSDEEGRQITSSLVLPGENFGEEVVCGIPRQYTAVAYVDTALERHILTLNVIQELMCDMVARRSFLEKMLLAKDASAKIALIKARYVRLGRPSNPDVGDMTRLCPDTVSRMWHCGSIV